MTHAISSSFAALYHFPHNFFSFNFPDLFLCSHFLAWVIFSSSLMGLYLFLSSFWWFVSFVVKFFFLPSVEPACHPWINRTTCISPLFFIFSNNLQNSEAFQCRELKNSCHKDCDWSSQEVRTVKLVFTAIFLIKNAAENLIIKALITCPHTHLCVFTVKSERGYKTCTELLARDDIKGGLMEGAAVKSRTTDFASRCQTL